MARKNLYPPSVTPGIPKLGVKPDGWETKTIGDVLRVVTRKADIASDTEYQLVTAKRNREGIVPRSILKGEEILTKTQFYIQEGDFLISRRQIIHGACGIVPPSLDGAIISNEYSTLRTKNGLLADYLRYFCHSVHFQQTCFHSSVGVDVEKMIFDLSAWLKHKIHLPPLSEQKQIVNLLGSWNEAIQLTSELIFAKQAQKRGLMQELLMGRQRFPDFRKGSEKQLTRFGELPADWTLKNLGSVGDINARSLTNEVDPEHQFRYIELSAVDKGVISLPTKAIEARSLPSRARRILQKGDVMLSTVRPNLLGYALCDFDPIDVICSTGFAVISPRLKSDSEFLHQSLYGDTIQSQIHGLVTGSNYPAINSSEVAALEMAWPTSPEERKKIGAVLEGCDQEVRLLQEKLRLLELIKQALMQRLLTGKIRVKL